MKLEITAAEAWEAVARLKATVDYNRRNDEWYASAFETTWAIGWGDTPLKAVAAMLEVLGETALAEVANV